MQDRFAFTAEYWGDAAVVCRATEDRPRPSVQQEGGKFATWTQANAFATRLNGGLEIDPAEAERSITGSILDATEVLLPADSPAPRCDRVRRPVAGKRPRAEVTLATL